MILALSALEEIIKAVHLATGFNLDNTQLRDKGEKVYLMAQTLGNFLGPIIGGCLWNPLGFRMMLDLFMISCLVYAFIYLIFNVVCIPDHDGFGFGQSAYAETLSHSDDFEVNDALDTNRLVPKDLPIGIDIPSMNETNTTPIRRLSWQPPGPEPKVVGIRWDDQMSQSSEGGGAVVMALKVSEDIKGALASSADATQ